MTQQNIPLLKVDEKLNEAIALIEKHGWLQGNYREHGKHCIVGAVASVCGELDEMGYLSVADSPKYAECLRYVGDYLNSYLGFDCLDVITIAEWNDCSGRTKDEVLHALHEGIKIFKNCSGTAHLKRF